MEVLINNSLKPLINSYPHSNVQCLIYHTVYSDMSCLDDLAVGISTVCCIQYPATLSKSYVQVSMEKAAWRSQHAKGDTAAPEAAI